MLRPAGAARDIGASPRGHLAGSKLYISGIAEAGTAAVQLGNLTELLARNASDIRPSADVR